MKNKQNPYVAKKENKVETKNQKPKFPFGLEFLVKQVIFEMDNGAIPSVVLGNAMVIAKSSLFPKELQLRYAQPHELPDDDKKKVVNILAKVKQPNVDFKKFLIEEFSSVWVKKIKPKEEKVEVKKPMVKRPQQKKFVEKKEPVVVIKKAKI